LNAPRLGVLADASRQGPILAGRRDRPSSDGWPQRPARMGAGASAAWPALMAKGSL